MAVIEALNRLQTIQEPCHVEINLDSQYVRLGITQWINGWKKNGWRTADKSPVKNAQIWMALDALVTNTHHQLSWQWIKGHSGNPGNERADFLANLGVDKARNSTSPSSLVANVASPPSASPARSAPFLSGNDPDLRTPHAVAQSLNSSEQSTLDKIQALVQASAGNDALLGQGVRRLLQMNAARSIAPR